MAASGQMKGVASPVGAQRGNEEGQKVAWGHVHVGLELKGKDFATSLEGLGGGVWECLEAGRACSDVALTTEVSGTCRR